MSTPVEKPEAIRQRGYVILSFWAVIVLLGLPTWWKTTSIPRTALPVDGMTKWESQRPQYIVTVNVAAPSLACEIARDLVANIQTTLDEQNEFDGFRLQTHLVEFEDIQGLKSPMNHNGCGLPKVLPSSVSDSLDVELLPGKAFEFSFATDREFATAQFDEENVTASVTDLVSVVRSIFSDEQAAVAYQYYTQGYTDEAIDRYVQSLPQDTVAMVQRAAARALKPSPEYHLTFSLFTAEGTPSSWDIEIAIQRYIKSLTHSLSSVANFSIATQIQLYSALSPSIQPYEVVDGEGWLLRAQDLTAFINTAEWPLSPSIGSGPTINFILYVPGHKQIPLRIEDNKGGSWLIPQWGGITISNPPLVTEPERSGARVVKHLDESLLLSAFEVFRGQLLSLLGVPPSPNLPVSQRLKAFQRLSSLSLYLRTASNLGSLARLSERLSNIPIPHHVLDLVENAEAGLRSYRENKDTKAIRVAYSASEKAFFDKSMVGQVYFPDEHKVAVYLPLLGPIGVPLVVALIREIKQRRSAK